MSENNTRYVDRAGDFQCQVKEPSNGWFGEAGEKQTPYIRLNCEVMDEGDQKGKSITYFAWLSDGAFDRTVKNLTEVFGWDGNLVELDNGNHTFAGMGCRIVCESEEYDGKRRVKAKWLNSLTGPAGEGMAKEKVASLISRLGRKAQAIAKTVAAEGGVPVVKAAPTQAAKPEDVSANVPEDDDIPF